MTDKLQDTRRSPSDSPFHSAELSLQERFGRRAQLAIGARRAILDHMNEQHRSFYPLLPFLLVGSVDRSGQPWASMLAGHPGFVAAPDPRHLHVQARPLADDPLSQNLTIGAPIGVLGIELPTRRRNRLNGYLTSLDEEGFSIGVVQSYGNCPQYIQARDLSFVSQADRPLLGRSTRSNHLAESDRKLVMQADTFFIASANLRPDGGAARGADVSHRGGRPGFVRIDATGTLTVPDFVGNYFFNTLGNLMVEPRAGLLFPDFESGDVLLLAADSEIVWEGPEVDSFVGAQRLVRFHVTTVIRLVGALPFRGSPPQYARELQRTGKWEETT
jgi:uncharacterized protein